jgi:phospholipase C
MTDKHVPWNKRIVFFAALAATTIVATGTAMLSLAGEPATTTPIKHVIVIFQENVSFDHYFGTYPIAANSTAGEPVFKAAEDTPAVNGLLTGPAAPPNNPTLAAFGNGTVQPFRLGRNQATTCDEDHNYTDEQAAYHAGQMDLVVRKLSSTSANCAADKSTVMGYYDGNTVTALCNYAQHFAMSDDSFGTTYGPSTPVAINLIAGNTHGVTGSNVTGFGPVPGINQTTGASGTATVNVAGSDSNGNTGGGSIVGDPRPFGDVCNPLGSTQVKISNPSRNVGDLLNAKGITWGWFQGGFGNCNSIHMGSDGNPKQYYIGHHEPFNYFPSTRNLHHLPPSSPAKVGQTDQANHQYDLNALFNELGDATIGPDITGFQPGVTPSSCYVLKAPGFMDGHAQYSDPLLEQHFITQVVSRDDSKYWKDTAIIILYDSDGWYDHVYPPLVNASARIPDVEFGRTYRNRPVRSSASGCCSGTLRLRSPDALLASRPSRSNYVDHTVTDQSSVLRFIEDNFSLGRIDQSPLTVAAGGSFDQIAGSINSMFDFDHDHDKGFDRDDDRGRGDHDDNHSLLILDPDTGLPAHR